jgi:asparagine synthase (glutamine-hydrolysing)
MCGIFGAVFSRDAVDVDAALRSISYRGPEESRVFRADDVILGHNRLRIIDLSPAASQPMTSADGEVVVVFNGEIYNHHALRNELAKLGHAFRSRSDTEVIVEGYRAWGDAVVARLDGMFALGIFDLRAHTLLLARDRAGKKPLFYTVTDRGLRFASEAKAILASGVVAELDPSSLPTLLAFGYPPASRSMYRGILQLPPASTLLFRHGATPVVRRYWTAPFASEPIGVPVDEACATIRALTEAAVRRRLEADVPLGAFLSGGIDSTIVVGIMARASSQKVKTFSIGFSGDARFDETHYARIASRAFGTDHTEFTVEPGALDLVEALVRCHDGPFGDSSAVPTSIVSKLTRQQVTVALTGDGGDELFCGYPRFLAAEAEEKIPALLRRAGRAVASSHDSLMSPRARRLLVRAALPLPERLAAWNAFFTPNELRKLLVPELQATVPIDEPLTYTRTILQQSEGASVLSRILHHNFETHLPNDLLVKADRASMLHSLELRSPFLDTALVEYASRARSSLVRRGTTMKWALKRAFVDLLPPEIQTRKKMGFGAPLGAWFRGGFRPYLLDYLHDRARLFELVERAVVKRLLTDHLDGRADNSSRLWLLLTLELWLRTL